MTMKYCLPTIARVFGLVVVTLAATVATGQEDVDFVKDIKPIFEKHCVVCHGPVEKEDEENDFRIDEREDALDYIGTDGAEDSDLFYLLVSDDEEEVMPPADHSKLTTEQITMIRNWIDQGADWPEDVELVDTSEVEDEPVETNDDGDDTQDDPNENGADQDSGSDKTTTDPTVKSKGPSEEKPSPILTSEKKRKQMFRATGSLHPAAVHLPIGLLLASGLFALFSLRGNFVMSDCAYYCLWLGTLGAIGACVTGWFYSPMEHRGEVSILSDLFDQTHEVFWHRTGSLIVTIFALILALFAAGARNRDPDDGALWKLGVILLAIGIGWIGHTGGELAYPNQYKDLNAIYERMISGEGNDTVVEENQNEPAKAENADVGKSSDESETTSD